MNDLIWNGVMWNHLIYPEHSPIGTDDDSVLTDWASDAIPDYVVCLALDGFEAAYHSVLDVLQQQLPQEYHLLAGFTHGNSLYFCGQCSDGPDQVLSTVEKIRQNISVALDITCTAGIAFLKDKNMRGWTWAAQRAVVAQRRKLREGSGRVYVFDDTYIPSEFSFGIYRGLEEQLHSLVRSGDTSGVDAFLSEASKLLFTDQYLALNHLRPVLQTQIILMSHELRSIGGNSEDIAEQTEQILARMTSTYDYSVIKDIFEESVIWFVNRSADLCSQHATRLVSKAETLLSEHLADLDLGLQMIARLTNSNPSYLSRVFKQQKGTGITTFINAKRIELAKRLLSDHTKSITDIAYDLGFGSLTHFERTFKSITNYTPSQYRQSKIVENK